MGEEDDKQKAAMEATLREIREVRVRIGDRLAKALPGVPMPHGPSWEAIEAGIHTLAVRASSEGREEAAEVRSLQRRNDDLRTRIGRMLADAIPGAPYTPMPSWGSIEAMLRTVIGDLQTEREAMSRQIREMARTGNPESIEAIIQTVAGDTLNERIAELERENETVLGVAARQIAEARGISDMLRREVETLHARITNLVESRPRSPALTDVDTDHATTHGWLFTAGNEQIAAWWHGLAEHTRTELQRVLSTHDVYSLLGAVDEHAGDATVGGYNRGRAAALAEAALAEAPVGRAVVELAAAVQAPPEADDRIAVSRDAFNQLVSAVSAAAVDEYERGRR